MVKLVSIRPVSHAKTRFLHILHLLLPKCFRKALCLCLTSPFFPPALSRNFERPKERTIKLLSINKGRKQNCLVLRNRTGPETSALANPLTLAQTTFAPLPTDQKVGECLHPQSQESCPISTYQKPNPLNQSLQNCDVRHDDALRAPSH